MLSPAAMARCAADGRFIVLDRNSRFKARVEGSVSGNVLLRSAQHEVMTDKEKSLEIARNMVACKLQNSRQIVLQGKRESTDETDVQSEKNK